MLGEPTDEELIAFAASILRDRGAALIDPELLQETISQNRDLWRTLYAISRDREHHGRPPG